MINAGKWGWEGEVEDGVDARRAGGRQDAGGQVRIHAGGRARRGAHHRRGVEDVDGLRAGHVSGERAQLVERRAQLGAAAWTGTSPTRIA
ncbi:hypothetical protein GCM10010199_67550 [Dactylosporangium roseum]